MGTTSFEMEAEFKRESILSVQKARLPPHLNDKKRLEDAPPDPFHLVHFIFFFFGMGNLIPMLFFFTAQDYWMYKFRDTSKPTYDLTQKTLLQQNFMSLSSIVNTVPGLISNLLATRYGHKINIRTRLVGSSCIVLVFFAIFTAFVKINTDSWQLGFFILTMCVSCALMMNGSLMMVSSLSLIARFPQTYMKSNQYGTSVAGIVSALLQVASLSIGDNPTSVALIYFLCGTTLIAITAALAYFSYFIPRFRHFLGDTVADMQRPTQSLTQMRQVAKKMWPPLVMMLTSTLSMGLAGPNITTMIVSEHYKEGGLWPTKYFTPVIIFMLPDVVSLTARYLAGPYMTHKNAPYVIAVDCLRQISVAPLMIFCNMKTANRHLPTVFGHDYQFIIILVVHNFLNNFFMTVSMMSTPNMVAHDPEQGFLFMSAVNGIVMPLASPLNALWVNVL